MRRYRLEIRGKAFEIDVDELAADRYAVVVDGETYEVELASDEDLPVARITPQLDAGPGHAAATPAAVAAEPARGPREVAAATPKSPAPSRRGSAGDAALLRAPMPGVVVEVSVTAGARVARGDAVVVLDAMKMNNTVRSPRDATIAEVLVAVGQAVGHGEPLVRFETG